MASTPGVECTPVFAVCDAAKDLMKVLLEYCLETAQHRTALRSGVDRGAGNTDRW
jgi:hypothetical protein